LTELREVEALAELAHHIGEAFDEEGLVAGDGHVVPVHVRVVLQFRAEILGAHLKLVGNYRDFFLGC